MSGDLRERVTKAKATPARKGARKREWNPLTLGQLADKDVLAFDQTVTKTGWVMLRGSAFGGKPVVLRRGVLKEPPIPEYTGHEGTLRRADNMCVRIEEIVGKEAALYPHLIVVHEMPAAYGMRVESSLMASLGVRLACGRVGVPFKGVASQHAKWALTGERDAQKKDVKDALIKLLPPESFMAVSDQRQWNLDQYDALALAVAYLYDLAIERAA